MEILVTNNITKKYKNQFALQDVNMHINEGDIYGFVGENGAGKTTIIRIICGLASPTKGSFKLFGVDNNSADFDNARKSISAIVEKPSIYSSFTALENLRFHNMVTGANKTDDELIELIKLVGLDYEAIIKKKAGNFSLGMKQRLGLAITMVSSPKFVVLDEPMNGLDPQGIIEVRETILNLAKKGVSFLISSHILSELEKVCNKVGFISKGKLLEEMTMEELHKKSRRKIVIVFENNDDIALLSIKLSLKDIENNNGELIIYDDINLNELLQCLNDNKINIKSINCIDETIEDYYMNLIRKELINAKSN